MAYDLEVDPAIIWFSQRSAGGFHRAQRIRASMEANGFIFEPANPINVVRVGDILTTIDNTRVAVAQELGISWIVVRINEVDETLPEHMIAIQRFGSARTWREALAFRLASQRPPLTMPGTPDRPHMK
ncbi:MAG: hypothetical protein SNJ54_00405 [Anaerolineae bacterium]